MKRITKVLLQAFGGSVGHNAGFGVLMVHVVAAIYLLGWIVFLVIGRVHGFPEELGFLLGLSFLFLVVGYVFNRPDME